jgi:hypothetical protein
MQSRKGLENKPNVGNGILVRRPPFGKTNCLSPMTKLNGFKQATEIGVIETRSFQKPKAVLKGSKTISAKGFGRTPLFVMGMFTTAEATGECIRLDDDTGRKDRLTEAEQICKRNPTLVRKLHQEEELGKNGHKDFEANEYENMPTDFSDDAWASDYGTKTRNFDLRKQVQSFKKGEV